MSDSDSDYCDVGADDFEICMADNYEVDKTKQTGGKSRGARGNDINWLPILNFEDVEDYDNSELFKLLKTKFTLQRSRDPDYADTETYICKFSRKVGYLPCPLKYKIDFLSNCDTVVAHSNDAHEKHVHDIDPEHSNSSYNFKWTEAQSLLIKQGVLNEASPTVSPNIAINGLLSFMFIRSSSETLMTPNSFRMVIVLQNNN